MIRNFNSKYLCHYGRKGMKWGENIFTDDDVDSFNKASKSKKPSDFYNVQNFSNPYTKHVLLNRTGPYTRQDMLNRQYYKKLNDKKTDAIFDLEEMAESAAKSIGDKVPKSVTEMFDSLYSEVRHDTKNISRGIAYIKSQGYDSDYSFDLEDLFDL